MRFIGSVADDTQAKRFGDFLVGRGIRNQVERESDGQWSVWIYEDEQIPEAQGWLTKFHAAPGSAEFKAAAAEAAKVRQAEADDVKAYRKRIRSRRQLFPKFGGHGIGFLTYALIAGSVAVSILAGTIPEMKEMSEFLRRILISDPAGGGTQFLPEVFKGQVWRLFTPIFVHFNLLHIVFNMLWLYQLGCMIEARQSTFHLAALVIVIALCSNVAQYFVSARYSFDGIVVYLGGGAIFGGMSGVVYGLAGYVWMRGRDDRASGLYLDPQSVTILLVWLVVCFTGIVGHIANAAHLAGLVVGMVWGWTSARLAPTKTD